MQLRIQKIHLFSFSHLRLMWGFQCLRRRIPRKSRKRKQTKIIIILLLLSLYLLFFIVKIESEIMSKKKLFFKLFYKKCNQEKYEVKFHFSKFHIHSSPHVPQSKYFLTEIGRLYMCVVKFQSQVKHHLYLRPLVHLLQTEEGERERETVEVQKLYNFHAT